MKPLVIIPARGGSKGVPGKNIKLLNGKPLIQYTIEAALEITDEHNIIVSTDCVDIKAVAENLGINVPSLRPENLASDTASTYEVLRYELDQLEKKNRKYDYIILLQPTSPFRTGKHIREALEIYRGDLEMVVSVKETKANPYFTLKEEDKNGYLIPSKKTSATRRQDVPKVYELNGAIYIIDVSTLKKMSLSKFAKVGKYVMDEISSHDIDTTLDWNLAQLIINKS